MTVTAACPEKKKMKQGSLLVKTFERHRQNCTAYFSETSLCAQFFKPDGLRFQFAIDSMMGLILL